ncbi:MAG: CrcB family protein [Halanaeroarchaeum sp.]
MPDRTARTVRTIETLALVAIGGFAGSNLRFFVGGLLSDPAALLAVNTAGSVGLGFLLYEARYSAIVSERTHAVVATGFLSSFTTYSTFALTSLRLGLAGIGFVAVGYALGFAGVLAGRRVALAVDRRGWR